jgi:septum formation protein
MSQLGIPFRVEVSDFAEDLDIRSFENDFTEYPLATAREKSQDILSKLGAVPRPTVLVTCDTVVLKDGKRIIEKPVDAEHARNMLMQLRGCVHAVVTGVSISLVGNGIMERSEFISVSHVKFAELSDHIIEAYVASGEPINKAGSYGIQGLGELLVEQVTGSYTNIVGLPLRDVALHIATLLERV